MKSNKTIAVLTACLLLTGCSLKKDGSSEKTSSSGSEKSYYDQNSDKNAQRYSNDYYRVDFWPGWRRSNAPVKDGYFFWDFYRLRSSENQSELFCMVAIEAYDNRYSSTAAEAADEMADACKSYEDNAFIERSQDVLCDETSEIVDYESPITNAAGYLHTQEIYVDHENTQFHITRMYCADDREDEFERLTGEFVSNIEFK